MSKNCILLLILFALSGCQPTLNTTEVEIEKTWLWTANWQPNGDQVSVGGNQDTLRLLSTSTHSKVVNIPMEGFITDCEWHPTKNILAISMQGGKTKSLLFDPHSMQRIELDSLDKFGARAIGWNRNGELLAVGDYSGYLNIYNEKGDLQAHINTNQKSLIGLDWHPQKDIVVAVGEKITMYDLANDTIFDIKPRIEDVLMLCVAWHPSGEFFVTGDYGDFEKKYPPLLQFWSADGSHVRNVEKSKSEFRNIAWSDDGEWLATGSEFVGLWNKRGELIKKLASENLIWGIDWNTTGDKIVTADAKGKVVVWDLKLGKSTELEY